jgi:hypothetical protein
MSGEKQYSSLNTILLDDSVLKAHLQPYNHLLIPEYDAILRDKDMAALDEEKKLNDPNDPRKFRFDRSLLAVIGVLDELSRQDSVCSWIRADGLWAGFKDRTEDGPAHLTDTTVNDDVTVHSKISHPDAKIANQPGDLLLVDGASSLSDEIPIHKHKRRKKSAKSKRSGLPGTASSPNNLVTNVSNPTASLSLDTPAATHDDEITPPNSQTTANPAKFTEASLDDTLTVTLIPEIAPGTLEAEVATTGISQRETQGHAVSLKARIY